MRRAISRRLVLVLVVVTAVAAALPLGVVPFRDWLEQRDRTEALRIEVEAVEAVNRGYEERIDALGTDDEVERLAREDYGLIRPDEEAYAVAPSPRSELGIPGVWPFGD
ncbi:MAG: septum formation initiator family protein [Actinomycetota bacterium]|nr:septum formation initiator family protein [Actinomycetota bacterium]MED5394118.1 septum formation initiator family protein [Actinomycetota bacterium]